MTIMKIKQLYILLAWAALTSTVASCTKEEKFPVGDYEPITISTLAPDTFGTKAMLSESTFKTSGNRIQIYDFVDNETNPHINDQIGPEVTGSSSAQGQAGVWPFVGGSHQWKPGSHKFFGWLVKDANMSSSNTPDSFFGSGFGFSRTFTNGTPSDVLTIPSKQMTPTTPQFDFMFSNVYTTEPTNTPVPLEFSHLFCAVSFGFINTSNASVSVSKFQVNIYQEASAKIFFWNSVEYTRGNSGVETFRTNNNSKTIASNGEVPNAFNYSATEQEYLLQWPITRTELSYCNMTITYRQSGKTYNNVSLSFPNIELLPGKKYHFNISFIDKQPIRVNYEVVDWHDIENIVTFE